MLSHDNILSNLKALYHIFPVEESSRCISYLPVSHVYERMIIYIYHYLGISIYYAENMATIGDNLREIQPHILTTVPRLLEKVYDKIIAKGKKLSRVKKSSSSGPLTWDSITTFMEKAGFINSSLHLPTNWFSANGGRALEEICV